MKKILLLLFVLGAFFVSKGQTAADTQKAKMAAKAYLVKRLNNPASYASASWGKLEKTYSTFMDSKDYKILNDSSTYYREAGYNVGDQMHRIRMANILNYSKDSTYNYYKDLSSQIDSASKAINDKLAAKEKNFKGVFDGYMIEHSFRARNSFNALIIQNWYFIFDKQMKVTHAGDSDETERKRQELQKKVDDLIGEKY